MGISLKDVVLRHQALEADIVLDSVQEVFCREGINNGIEQLRDATKQDVQVSMMRALCSQEEVDKIESLYSILTHPELDSHIDTLSVTLGLVKPNTHQALDSQRSDDEIANEVIASIAQPLVVIARQAVWITEDETRAFYANLPASIIDRVSEFMSSGAVTPLVLMHEAGGDAIQEWRSQMGPTDPSKGTGLRKRYAREIENNVLHGSDSVATVRSEIEWFRKKVALLRSA